MAEDKKVRGSDLRLAIFGRQPQPQPALVRHARLRQPRQGQPLLQKEKRRQIGPTIFTGSSSIVRIQIKYQTPPAVK
jgi:hypothetical protein